MKLSREEFEDVANDATIESYEQYLEESEDKATSNIREDAFINGFRRGMEFIALLMKKEVKGETYE